MAGWLNLCAVGVWGCRERSEARAMAMAEARAEAKAGRVAWGRRIKVCQVASWDPVMVLGGHYGRLADRACRRRVGVAWEERGGCVEAVLGWGWAGDGKTRHLEVAC